MFGTVLASASRVKKDCRVVSDVREFRTWLSTQNSDRLGRNVQREQVVGRDPSEQEPPLPRRDPRASACTNSAPCSQVPSCHVWGLTPVKLHIRVFVPLTSFQMLTPGSRFVSGKLSVGRPKHSHGAPLAAGPVLREPRRETAATAATRRKPAASPLFQTLRAQETK